ncbi:protoheme IX farnesyltransferase [Halalkalibacillus sediminis]|uniref:Protoheme IX farnesyltransferase n=1 Tax=Halalkalibacillus sediminis TaxID=2018042 RepID=A0A2I0QWM3_9BACI|nr:heme o synthase [Halalkalibacillus sediminis]PKR78500.1 protoheme IX farnesyltransferase [Halalkalibacillus sediminis]
MQEPRSLETTSSHFVDSSSVSVKSLWGDFLALIKIGIINSNLMTAFAGFWLALYFTDQLFFSHWDTFLLVMAGTALVIAGGCVINNYYDRDIDQNMSRTSKRPTITGTIPLSVILGMGISFSILGLILLYLTTPMAAVFGFIGWFVYVVLYTMWSKRKYTINTVVGSFSGAAPPLIGWAAIDSTLHPVAFVLFLIMFIWQTPHFLALAIMKRDEYAKAGIPMLPVVYGNGITKRQIMIYTICLMPLPYYFFSLGITFLIFATLLNIGWVALAVYGFKMKDDDKWARWMFIYSLNYLTLFFIGLIVATIPAFL